MSNTFASYRDYANVSSADIAAGVGVVEGQVGRLPFPGSNRNFPSKLHYAISSIEREGDAHIVGWLPHGRSFVVHNQKEFVDKMLNCWFRQSKYTSFQRQLNLYGFKRVVTGCDKGSYYHPLFLRGKSFLADRIPRHEIKGCGPHRPDQKCADPNFYGLPVLPPTPISHHQGQQQSMVRVVAATSLPVLHPYVPNGGIAALSALAPPPMLGESFLHLAPCTSTTGMGDKWLVPSRTQRPSLSELALSSDANSMAMTIESIVAARKCELEKERRMLWQQQQHQQSELASASRQTTGSGDTATTIRMLMQSRHIDQEQQQHSNILGGQTDSSGADEQSRNILHVTLLNDLLSRLRRR